MWIFLIGPTKNGTYHLSWNPLTCGWVYFVCTLNGPWVGLNCALDVFWVALGCFGYALGMLWACFRCVLYMFLVCFMCLGCFGYALGMLCRTCFRNLELQVEFNSTKSLKIYRCKRWSPKDLPVHASTSPMLTHSLIWAYFGYALGIFWIKVHLILFNLTKPEIPWPHCWLPAFTSSFLRNMICEKTKEESFSWLAAQLAVAVICKS